MSWPKRILVVDDDHDVCLAVTKTLELAGYKTEMALSGADALSRASADPPDLVVLDLMMPGLDGFSTFRALTSQWERAVPFLFITATSLRIAEDELAAVPHLTLQKPLDFGELVQRAAELLKKAP